MQPEADTRAACLAAADEERRRVVRDLHDGAQQRLVHTIITLKLAAAELAGEPGRAAELVDEALLHAESAMADLRELARGITPTALRCGGLHAAARALAAQMPMPVEVDMSTDRLPEEIEVTAYFVVAEALTNVAKHACAHRAVVTARVGDRALRVEVRDDGVGRAVACGSGLTGLRDRVIALGGSFGVHSRPAVGTVVTATIPLGVRERRRGRFDGPKLVR